ncbi:hypothetical protein Vi05172_g12373 [Venturia inaequalis]|nr:hypothetical protein Vi05172_g12373 [Venturia inaequalis]
MHLSVHQHQHQASTSTGQTPPHLFDENIAYDFAGEQHFSPEFIQSLTSPYQHSPYLILIPCLLAPFSLLAIYIWASPPEIMTSSFHFLKSLLFPAFLALLLYVLLSWFIIPLYRRHRARYAQYLPVHTNPISSLSSSTQNLRSNITSALLSFLLPSRWAEYRHQHRQNNSRVVDARDGDEELGNGTTHHFENGDIGYGIGDSEDDDDDDDEVARGRRDGLSLSMDARSRSRSNVEGADSNRRLSRELEEGFRDDSDDEHEDVVVQTIPR